MCNLKIKTRKIRLTRCVKLYETASSVKNSVTSPCNPDAKHFIRNGYGKTLAILI